MLCRQHIMYNRRIRNQHESSDAKRGPGAPEGQALMQLSVNFLTFYNFRRRMVYGDMLRQLIVIPHLHDTTGCQSAWTTGWTTACIV